jgi:metal-dependent HD superfamily phosphatase/phosphodiesterase
MTIQDETLKASAHQDADGETAAVVTARMVRDDPEVRQLISLADQYLNTIGYTDHGLGHVSRVAERARRVLKDLGYSERECELAAIAGYMHDIGNMVHRVDHAHSSALLSYPILRRMGMPLDEIACVVGAIANHDEGVGEPVSSPSAALILADKSDVLRTRVRNPKMISFDIHDRVNYAAESTQMEADRDKNLITLRLKVDTSISQVIEYFEIFMSRMAMSRRAATFLNCDLSLIINDVVLM